eukprot:1748940-Pyramimonas_sp.AAC.1
MGESGTLLRGKRRVVRVELPSFRVPASGVLDVESSACNVAQVLSFQADGVFGKRCKWGAKKCRYP